MGPLMDAPATTAAATSQWARRSQAAPSAGASSRGSLTVTALLMLASAGLALSSAADPQVIPLWPEGVPAGKPGEERVVDERVYNVHHPTLTYVPPNARCQ